MDEKKEIKPEVMKKCSEILKENTSLFSDFRTFSFPIIIQMSLHKNPEEYLKLLQKNYKVLTKKSIFNSYYKLITAMVASDYEKNINAETLSAREKKIYDMMNKKHPFLTGDEDLSFATLFALTGKKEEKLISEMEQYYEVLKDYIDGNNNAQTIAEVLVLESGNKVEKIKKVVEIYTLLKESKKKLFDDFLYVLIASLANLKESSKTIVDAILEVDSYIGSQKGRGLWTLGKTKRLMMAIFIVENYYCKSHSELKNITLMNTIILNEIVLLIICMNMTLLMD